MPILPLQKRRNQTCVKTGLVLFAFFAGLVGAFSAKAQDVPPVFDPVSPFSILDDKWATPEDLFSGKNTSLPSEIEVPALPEKEIKTAEEELPVLTPPLMPGPWAWKSVQDVPVQDDPLPFFDDSKHWKNLGDVRDQLDRFHEITSLNDSDSSIRFPLLPRSTAFAIADVRISKPKLEIESKAAAARAKAEGRLAKKEEKKKKKERFEKTSKACVALSERRKRELEAIESDRRTLSALRGALKDLGVTKKLAFMTEGATSVPLMSEDEGVKPTEKISP